MSKLALDRIEKKLKEKFLPENYGVHNGGWGELSVIDRAIWGPPAPYSVFLERDRGEVPFWWTDEDVAWDIAKDFDEKVVLVETKNSKRNALWEYGVNVELNGETHTLNCKPYGNQLISNAIYHKTTEPTSQINLTNAVPFSYKKLHSGECISSIKLLHLHNKVCATQIFQLVKGDIVRQCLRREWLRSDNGTGIIEESPYLAGWHTSVKELDGDFVTYAYDEELEEETFHLLEEVAHTKPSYSTKG